jgi:hypothetical protein
MTERKRKAPRSLAHKRTLEVEYDGGVGAAERFRFTLTLAEAHERVELDVLRTEHGAASARAAKGADGVFAAAMEGYAREKRRAGLTGVERRVYELCFAHVHAVEIIEDGEAYEAELADGLAWHEMGFEQRLAWAQRHPGLWGIVQQAILPTTDAEVEGKHGGQRAGT